MNEPKKRIIFAGTPDFAVASLAALHARKDVDIVAVYTQPDRPKGRGQKLQPSPVKAFALEHDLPVEQPVSLKGQAEQQQIATYKADLMVVVAYGLILPQAVLDMPKLGCVNIHASLLPRWRGAAPIHRAIEAGDQETGVGIMQMQAGLDTGPVLAEARVAIDDQISTPELHDVLAQLGGETLAAKLDAIFAQQLVAQPQSETAVKYAEKLSKAEAKINWADDASVIQRKIRAYQPWPVAYTQLEGSRLRLWQAEVVEQSTDANAGEVLAATAQGILVQCGHQALLIHLLQPENKAKMLAKDFANGRSLGGKQLG